MFLLSVYFADGLEIFERKINYSQNIFLCSAFLVFIILLFVKLNFKSYITQLFANVFSLGGNNVLVGKNDKSTILATRLTNFACILNLGGLITSLIVYSRSKDVSYDVLSTIYILLTCIVIVALLRILSYLVLSGVGYLLNIREITKRYYLYISDIFKTVSIVFFPIFLLIVLWGQELYNVLFVSALAVAVAALVLRAYVFFYYSFKIKFLNHYSILYFCTFEIIPILFLIHFIGKL